MSQLRRNWLRLWALIRRGAADQQLDRELRAHLRLIEDDFVARGLSPDEAYVAARRQFHGIEHTKEQHRDARSFGWLAGWSLDLKLGIRMLRKSAGVTVVAGLTLALAIAAGAVYLEFTRDFASPRLAVPQADRLVGIQVWDTVRLAAEHRLLADFIRWREDTRAVERLGAARLFDRRLITSGDAVQPVRLVAMSASGFELAGAKPLAGRVLQPADERADAPPVMVLGEHVSRGLFGEAADAVGQQVRLDDVDHAVVGVMPEAFAFPLNQDAWTPLKTGATGVRGEGPAIRIFGRLTPNAGPEAAEQDLHRLLPDASPTLQVHVRPFVESMVFPPGNHAAPTLFAGNLLFVLLVALCAANVTTLIFARAVSRSAELSLRTALGASRRRLVGQLFAEALVLCGLAAAAGLLVARVAGRWITTRLADLIKQPLPFWWDHGLTWTTIGYAAALAVVAAAIVGVLPALRVTGPTVQARLREATAGAPAFGRMWTGVTLAQIAVTVVSLAAVGSLAWTTYRTRQNLDVTFPRDAVMVARVAPEDEDRAPLPQSAGRYRALGRQLLGQRGVMQVAFASVAPGVASDPFTFEVGESGREEASVPRWCRSVRVDAGYFETLGLSTVSGRVFTPADAERSGRVAVVDETFVQLHAGGRNPVGMMIRGEDDRDAWFEIVGVVRNLSVTRRRKPTDATIYFPETFRSGTPVHVIIRTSPGSSGLTYRLELAAAGEGLRLAELQPAADVAESAAFEVRLSLLMTAVIGGVTLLLSVAGIYALISFTVSRRTREMAIRSALGASPARVVWGVLSGALWRIAVGVALGAAPAIAVLSLGAEDSDSLGLAGGGLGTLLICTGVMAVAAIACAGPLRSAFRNDPVAALRADA